MSLIDGIMNQPVVVGTITEQLSNLLNWNLILVVIFGCSVVAFAVFVDRYLHLRRSEIDTGKFVITIRKAVEDGDIVDAIRLCESTKGALSSIIHAGLLKHDRGKEQIESSMESSGLLEVAKLEKNTKVLSVIAHITPLIGLLGTVLGFIRAFSEMRIAGLMDISATQIGAAMEYALVTTAAGLVVAIPTVVAYNYLVSRIQGFVLEMQTVSPEIVDMLIHRDSAHEV